MPLFQLLETELELDPQEILVLHLSDAKRLSCRQLGLQELHQLGLVDEVLQCHRCPSGDLAGGLLCELLCRSFDIQLLLNIEEHLSLRMQLVATPLGKTWLA